MVPITSSAASLTDSARKRGAAPPANAGDVDSLRITSTPPPPGRCTSSSTTSGRCSAMTVTASSTSAASARTSTWSPSSARTPRRNIAWSSTITTATRRVGSGIGLLLSGRPREVQAYLGPLTEGRSDLGSTAVPLHAVHDAAAHTVAVPRDRLGVEAEAAVADEDVHRGVGDLGVDVHAAGAGVLGGVGDGLAGSVHDRSQGLGEVAVADRHHVHRDAVGVLDPRRRAAQRAGRGALVGGLPGVEPGAQVALLGAGQPGDHGAVGGVLLDEGERLEHRVVQ